MPQNYRLLSVFHSHLVIIVRSDADVGISSINRLGKTVERPESRLGEQHRSLSSRSLLYRSLDKHNVSTSECFFVSEIVSASQSKTLVSRAGVPLPDKLAHTTSKGHGHEVSPVERRIHAGGASERNG